MIRPVLLAGLAALTIAAAPARKNALDAEFAASDTNHDGVLSRAEIAARAARMHVQGGNVAPADMKRLSDIWFARADANYDGKVTKAEMQALFNATAAKYDANHDGVISIAERKAARAAAERELQAETGAKVVGR